MIGRLNNQVAVITGGNSGIGFSIANLFKQQGASIAIFARNPATLQTAENSLGSGTLAVSGDVTNLSDIDNFYTRISNRFKKIDILVVNAGVMEARPCELVDEANFDRQSDINFKGAYFTAQKSLRLLREGGTIIFISSILSEKGTLGTSIYGATKAAVRSLARSFAFELAPKKIRVNSISPGLTDTPFSYHGIAAKDHKVQVDIERQKKIDAIPFRRPGNPMEVARAALFLASQESSYVTGVDIVVDGGVLI